MPRKKLTDMTKEEIIADVEKNEAKRSALFKQKEPIDKALTRLYNRNNDLQDQYAKIKEAQTYLDWPWLLEDNMKGHSHVKYQAREKALRDIGLNANGTYPAIKQVQVRVVMVKNDEESVPKTLKGLNQILEYLKPIKGYKRLGIFELTLCQHGIYSLLVNEKKEKYIIQITERSKDRVLSSHKTLKEALEEIQDNYYYEDKNAEYEYNEYY